MPRFQPGPNRYFGAAPRPTSSITASILPGFRRPLPTNRPPRPVKPSPYTIGKTERLDITKKLLKMPNYVPRSTTKALKTFAKHVMADQGHYSKEERAFAKATIHSDHAIKDTEAQKKFIEGEVAALVDIKDPRVKDTFRFTHRSEEVAGQTLRGLVKEQKEKVTGPSVSEKRESIKPRSEANTAVAAPQTPAWTAPVQLDAAAGQADSEGGSGWPAAFAPAHHSPVTADAVHASPMAMIGNMMPGRSADLAIISDRLADAEIHDWEKVLNLRLRRLPLATLPLIHAFPNLPPTMIIDAPSGIDLRQVKLPVTVKRVAIYHSEGVSVTTPTVPFVGQKEVVGELNLGELQALLGQEK